MDIADVRKNTKLFVGGVPFNVEEADFMKPGKGRAIYRLKLKNLLDGSSLDRTYHSGEKVDEATTNVIEGQYLYKEGENYVFMNTENFEQHYVGAKLLGSKKDFLKEGMVVSVLMLGDRPIDITLPTFVELRVVEAGISTKTATITPQMKSAIMETGLTIGVPSFVKKNDIIKVDTRTGNYVERITAKK